VYCSIKSVLPFHGYFSPAGTLLPMISPNDRNEARDEGIPGLVAFPGLFFSNA
jgi:hypothetical protein